MSHTHSAQAAHLPSDGGTSAIVYLDSTLGIQQVEVTFKKICELRAESRRVIVDVSRVTVIDTAGVQLLLVLQKESQRPEAHVSVRGRSAAILSAMTSLGLKMPLLNPEECHVE